MEQKTFNGAWWYGKLGPLWFVAQALIYFPMIWTIIHTGWTWRIAIAVEAIISFALMLWGMKAMAKHSLIKDKETKLLTSLMLFAMFLSIVLIPPASPYEFDGPLKDRNFLATATIMVIYVASVIYFSSKSIRATQALAKKGPIEPKIVP